MTDNNTLTEVSGLSVLKFALLGAITILHTGCATQSPPAPVAVAGPPVQATNSRAATPTTPIGESADPTLYIARLKALSAPQLLAEVTANRLRLRAVPSAENRIRLALALWASGGDDQEIQALAESSLATESEQIRGIGSLIIAICMERRRNSDIANRSLSRSRESKRELEAQNAKVDALQRQIVELERKLEALREMEKSLSQRPGMLK